MKNFFNEVLESVYSFVNSLFDYLKTLKCSCFSVELSIFFLHTSATEKMPQSPLEHRELCVNRDFTQPEHCAFHKGLRDLRARKSSGARFCGQVDVAAVFHAVGFLAAVPVSAVPLISVAVPVCGWGLRVTQTCPGVHQNKVLSLSLEHFLSGTGE